MSLELILGLTLGGFSLIYFSASLEKDHFALRLLMIFFFLYLFTLIPKAALDNETTCAMMVNQTVVSGNMTNYTYSPQCVTVNSSAAETFFRLAQWLLRIVSIYLFGYLIYEILRRLDYIPRGKV